MTVDLENPRKPKNKANIDKNDVTHETLTKRAFLRI
jgi:hypothetical protein